MMKTDMKRLFGFVAVAAAVAAFFSCTPKGACVIDGNVSYPQYETIYMVDIAGEVVDSAARASDGDFRFVYDKVDLMPQMVVLEFRNKDVPADRMYLPVALEPGDVKVNIGEYIGIWGTPLNYEVKDFFDDLQALTDEYAENVSTVDQMDAAFSSFYLEKMQENQDNVFGVYLKLAYARELLGRVYRSKAYRCRRQSIAPSNIIRQIG